MLVALFPFSLCTAICFSSRQVSESLQVRIVAGRPIHCQVPGIDHHLVKWAAVRATLEAAKAIALSHLGTLYIAETDERRINRIQQVRVENIIIHRNVITASIVENLFPNHNIISVLHGSGHLCMCLEPCKDILVNLPKLTGRRVAQHTSHPSAHVTPM